MKNGKGKVNTVKGDGNEGRKYWMVRVEYTRVFFSYQYFYITGDIERQNIVRKKAYK